MKIKTIKRIVQGKVEDWISTIDNPKLRTAVSQHYLVSGGSIASLLLGEQVNDYDVYIQDRATLIDLVNYYLHTTAGRHDSTLLTKENVDEFSSDFLGVDDAKTKEQMFNGANIIFKSIVGDRIKIFDSTTLGQGRPISYNKEEEKPYRLKFISPNALSLSDDIQIVIRFFGTPEQIHETFDYIHATNYVTQMGIFTNTRALESLLTKELIYQGSHYPVTSIIRMKKFISRKWTMNAGEILKILFQVSQLDLSDPAVLEEQLIGVDVAYFAMLINALSKRPSDTPLTSGYLFEMIDRIFSGNPEAADAL